MPLIVDATIKDLLLKQIIVWNLDLEGVSITPLN